jgi:hypothetical protein
VDKEIWDTIKFGGGNLIFWGCMIIQGIGYGCYINGHMNAEIYTSILDNYLLPMIKYYKLKKNKLFFQ